MSLESPSLVPNLGIKSDTKSFAKTKRPKLEVTPVHYQLLHKDGKLQKTLYSKPQPTIQVESILKFKQPKKIIMTPYVASVKKSNKNRQEIKVSNSIVPKANQQNEISSIKQKDSITGEMEASVLNSDEINPNLTKEQEVSVMKLPKTVDINPIMLSPNAQESSPSISDDSLKQVELGAFTQPACEETQIQNNTKKTMDNNGKDVENNKLLIPPPPPPPPPPPSFAAPASSQIKGKLIFWEKIKEEDSTNDTIWERIKNQQLANAFALNSSDTNDLFNIFAQQMKGKASKNDSSNSNAMNKTIQLIDPAKVKSVTILLSGLKMQPETVLKYIYELDFTAFNETQLKMLLTNAPTNEDYKAIDSYTGDRRRLGICEKFFLAIRDMSRMNDDFYNNENGTNNELLSTDPNEDCIEVMCYKARIMLMFSKLTTRSTLKSLVDKLMILHDSLYNINNSTTLMKTLACILQLGNILNQGTIHGNAFGFDISILPKLADIKSSTIENYNLLNYIAARLNKEDEECKTTQTEIKESQTSTDETPLSSIEKLRLELPNVMLCDRFDLDAMKNIYKEVSDNFTNLVHIVELLNKKLEKFGDKTKRDNINLLMGLNQMDRGTVCLRSQLNPFFSIAPYMFEGGILPINETKPKVHKKRTRKHANQQVPGERSSIGIHDQESSSFAEMSIKELVHKFHKHEKIILPMSDKIKNLFELIDQKFEQTYKLFTNKTQIDNDYTPVEFVSTFREFVLKLERADEENMELASKDAKKIEPVGSIQAPANKAIQNVNKDYMDRINKKGTIVSCIDPTRPESIVIKRNRKNNLLSKIRAHKRSIPRAKEEEVTKKVEPVEMAKGLRKSLSSDDLRVAANQKNSNLVNSMNTNKSINAIE